MIKGVNKMNIENSVDIYRLFLQNLPHPVWISDINTTVIFINEYYEKMYNVKADDIIGKKHRCAVPGILQTFMMKI